MSRRSVMMIAKPVPFALVLVAGAAGLIVTLTSWPSADSPASPLPRSERARAAAFLAVQRSTAPPCGSVAAPRACVVDAYEDVDGDRRADCWQMRTGVDDAGEPAATLIVWRGCAAQGVTFEVPRGGLTELVIPPTLAGPWLPWIGHRFVGASAVQCAGGGYAGCPAPGPAWQWVLDSANRGEAHPGRHGTVALRWQTGERVASPPTALVVPHVEAGWMHRLRRSEEPVPSEALVGARVLVDGGVAAAPGAAVRCAGLDIVADRDGLVAVDPDHRRWAWLFRGLLDYGGFPATTVICADDVVLASTGDSFGSVAVVDPRTGGWLFDPVSDYGRTTGLALAPDGDGLLSRDYGLVRWSTVRAWLATPTARRAVLVELARAERPELDAAGVMAATEVGRRFEPEARPGRETFQELYGEVVPAASITAAMRASLQTRGSCQGWKLWGSGTAVLAERGASAQWLIIESERVARRFQSVRCDAGRVVITRFAGHDLLRAVPPTSGEGRDELDEIDEVVIDVARRRWSVRGIPARPVRPR